MDIIFINTILVMFPILIYLVLCCLNVFKDKSIYDCVFLLTIITSIYLNVQFNIDYGNNQNLLMFSNIPILVCCLKKKLFLGILISVCLLLFLYIYIDNFIYVTLIKYILYLVTYLSFYKKGSFSSSFLKFVALIQGFLIFFEFLIDISDDFIGLLIMMILLLINYLISFACLYLFKVADDIENMHSVINKAKKDIEIKDSLFKLTHEVKNPIAVCKGYLDMIDVKNEENAKRYLDVIRGEIGRSLNIMNDFMDYSKIKIVKEEFDMSMLLESIYDSFKLLGGNRNIKFIYDNDYEEIYLNGDYCRLEQVFINIIKNSMESIRNNGIIKLHVNCTDDKVIVTISDNGSGMDEFVLSNIKNMFYTTKKDGTGLGVALSNEIILSHNGTIDYESTVGVGTTCTIVIPF